MSKRSSLLLALLLLMIGVGVGLVGGYGVSEMSRGRSLTQVVQDIATPGHKPGSPVTTAPSGQSRPVPPPDGKPVNFGRAASAVSLASSLSEGVFPPGASWRVPAASCPWALHSQEELAEYRQRVGRMPQQHREESEIRFRGGRFIPLGSGFVVSPSGLVVTNKHVVDVTVEVGPNPTIRLVNGETYEAEIAGSDAETDVALLRVHPSEPMEYMTWADSDQTRIGDWLIAIGNPFGLESSVSLGILSARGRQLEAPPGSGGHTYDDYLQTDAAINPGNSGGPLINVNGQVVGINTAIQTAGVQSPFGAPGNIGIGFAIPSNLASWVIQKLDSHGEVERGYIGVQIPSSSVEREASSRVEGATLLFVEPDGPAAGAGLKTGDVIIRMGDHAIPDSKSLIDYLARTDVGARLDVEFIRDGKNMTATVTVAKRPPVDEIDRTLNEPKGPMDLDDILE